MEKLPTVESAYASLWESPKVKLTQKTGMPTGAGIYSVWSDDVLVYVGISTDIRGRWRSHECLDRIMSECVAPDISWLPMSIDDAKKLEAILIRTFKPKLNRSGNPDWVKEGRHSSRPSIPCKDISVRLTDETYIKINKAASESKRSISSFIRILLEEHFADTEPKADLVNIVGNKPVKKAKDK